MPEDRGFKEEEENEDVDERTGFCPSRSHQAENPPVTQKQMQPTPTKGWVLTCVCVLTCCIQTCLLALGMYGVLGCFNTLCGL